MMLSFVFSALAVVIDQLFKRFITLALGAGGEEIVLIPGVIGLTYVHNYGAAFGIFSSMRWPLVAVKIVVCVLLVMIMLRYNGGFWGFLGFAAVLGGGIGNLIDRLFLGYVVDMFELYFVNFAIFNIADIFIVLGGITFCVYHIATYDTGNKDEKSTLSDDKALLGENNIIEFSDLTVDDGDMFDTKDLNSDAEIIAKFSEAVDEYIEQTTVPDDYDLDDILREYGLESDEE